LKLQIEKSQLPMVAKEDPTILLPRLTKNNSKHISLP